MKEYSCSNCSKSYKHRQNLYVHRKKCNINNNVCKNATNNIDIAFCSRNIAEINSSSSQNIAFCSINDYPNQNSNENNIILTYDCKYCSKSFKHS